jgi:tRNA-2-methylthio-N6-dimethylallyladenosine synthase
MHRPYQPKRFLEICRKMRDARPGLAITTDVIVGFPGESDGDYQATRQLVREADFDNAFVFRYSKRRGTPAAEIPDELQVPERIKEERNQDLLALVNELGRRKLEALVGSEVEVLCEGYSKTTIQRLTGRTSQNKIVVFEGNHARLKGEIFKVRILASHSFTLYGDASSKSGSTVPADCPPSVPLGAF